MEANAVIFKHILKKQMNKRNKNKETKNSLGKKERERDLSALNLFDNLCLITLVKTQ